VRTLDEAIGFARESWHTGSVIGRKVHAICDDIESLRGGKVASAIRRCVLKEVRASYPAARDGSERGEGSEFGEVIGTVCDELERLHERTDKVSVSVEEQPKTPRSVTHTGAEEQLGAPRSVAEEVRAEGRERFISTMGPSRYITISATHDQVLAVLIRRCGGRAGITENDLARVANVRLEKRATEHLLEIALLEDT
jgi:hypothetical protein